MKRTIRLLSLTLLSLLIFGPLVASGQYSFDDEFNGNSLDTAAWVPLNRPGDSSNNEQQYLLPSNVSVSGGNLAITCKVDSSQPGYGYTSGMVQWKSFNFTYGTVKFRAKMAGGQGTWPSVWLLGSNCQQTNVPSADNVPPCNWPEPGSDEIDIAEIYGGLTTVHQSVHSGSTNYSYSASTTDVSQC
jgi:beta-glucanase (GH16 family)